MDASLANYRPAQVLPAAARIGWPIRFKSFAPASQLEPYIVRYWHASSRAGVPEIVHHRVVPDGCIELVFDVAGSTLKEAAVVTGPARRSFMVPLPHHANYLGVRFRPGAFFKIFGIPAGELTDRIVPLVDMGGHVCGSLTESLRSCCPVGDQIRVIECAVFRCLHNEHDEDERLRVALAAIMETAGTLRTTDLARRACMSPRQLRRLFDRYVGLSPKTFCRIVRFQRVLSAFKHRGPGKQLPLALTAGYYDQAHFLHEFQEFAGISPSALFQAPAH